MVESIVSYKCSFKDTEMRVCEKGLEKESFVLVVGKKIERTNATRKRQQKR